MSTTLSAQSLNKKGFVVLHRGDTLHGFIKYKAWEYNPKKIKFYFGTNKIPKVYSVSELLYFEILGMDAYRRRVLYKPNELGVSSPEYTWMRELVRGDVMSLYQLNDGTNQFYIKEKEADYIKLKYPNNRIKMYIPMLKAYAMKVKADDALLKAIDNSEYSEKDLIDIVRRLNNYGPQKNTAISLPASSTLPKAETKPSFFISAGAGISTLTLKGDSYLDGLIFESTTMPYISFGIQLTGGQRQKMSFRLEVNYTSVSFQGKSINTRSFPTREILYDFKQSNITPVFSFLYKLTNKEPLDILTGVGIGYNFSNYSKNQYHQIAPQDIVIEDYTPMGNSWFSGQLKLIGLYKKKFELGAYYQIFGTYTQSIHYSYDPSTFAVWLGYHF
ncbi:hypothetical protein [uncultured Polaribacter sp.]|uniref:hypothetical protein n=1 Tax=uncultured Polaribacter sp. TaxID=174711 RepID=UPI00262199AE|nr:hypothetical protein [uncultured Polaribacter sp.]